MYYLGKKSTMAPSGKILTVDNFKNLGKHNLSRFYKERLFPKLNAELAEACRQMEMVSNSGSTPDGYDEAINTSKEILKLFSVHSTHELKFISQISATDSQIETIQVEISKIKKEHKKIQSLFEKLTDIANKFRLIPGISPYVKLADAHFSNLKQDFALLFFLEEEYLFPRLPELR
ncbi:hypothetical protein BH09BAC5_BH09BAC5_12430 [soil metagenome]